MLPCGTPSSAQVHEVPSLDQFSPKTVVVVPLVGEIEAEQVGTPPPSTSTVLDIHDVVPPGPMAVSVKAWLPGANVIELAPVHAIVPCGMPSSDQVHEVPSLDQSTPNIVEVVPPDGLIDAAHVGAPEPSTVTVLDVHAVVPPGPTAVSVTA
jgi:hypothetical protein